MTGSYNHCPLLSIYYMSDASFNPYSNPKRLGFLSSWKSSWKWRLREVSWLIQCHTASKWQSWDLSPGLSNSEDHPFAPDLHSPRSSPAWVLVVWLQSPSPAGDCWSGLWTSLQALSLHTVSISDAAHQMIQGPYWSAFNVFYQHNTFTRWAKTMNPFTSEESGEVTWTSKFNQ